MEHGEEIDFSLFDHLLLALEEVNEDLRGVETKLNSIFDVLGDSSQKAESIAAPRKDEATERVEMSLDEVLALATCVDNKVILNTPRLDQDSYKKVDNLLRCLGGKWVGGKTQAHVFSPDVNPECLIKAFVEKGEIPDLNPLAFFATSSKTANKIVSHIHPKNIKSVLDAGAGEGALSVSVKARFPHADIDLVEIDPGRAEKLRQMKLGTVFQQDFLEFDKGDYTCVIMNPPFRVKADAKAYVTHIQHAWNLLGSEGQLIAIAPLGFTFSQEKRCVEFKDFVERFGFYEELPQKSFEGTNVSAVAIFLEKPRVHTRVFAEKQQQLTLF
jgi:predicted RNA methylase